MTMGTRIKSTDGRTPETGALSAAEVTTVRAIITGRMSQLRPRMDAATDPAAYVAACDKTEYDTLAWVLKLIDAEITSQDR